MKIAFSSTVWTLGVLMLCGAAQAQVPPGSAGHVIIIVQENRSTDNLFHDPVLIANGADIASYGKNSKGQQIKLTGEPLDNTYNLNHEHADFVNMYDGGKMDGADKIKAVQCTTNKNCPPANPQFKYVNGATVQPYFQMAEQYVFADAMFQTNQGDSYPSHQFLVSGTSAPSAGSNLFDMGNPFGELQFGGTVGCTAPKEEYVVLINPQGQGAGHLYPCFEHATLTDLLDNAGLTWAYYAPQPDNIWVGLNPIKHIRLGHDWQYVISKPNQILTDIKKSQLRDVSWVIPQGQYSDHPGSNNGLGPSWVASIVNAIGSSPYWNDTVIFITWDDWGGWYDHVAPKVINDGKSWGSGYVYGFRVPLVIVSSLAKPKYISHVTHDFGSILRFVEENYSLPSLGYADAYADDLSDCFNFGQRVGFQQIKAPYAADYFINDKSKPTPPDED